MQGSCPIETSKYDGFSSLWDNMIGLGGRCKPSDYTTWLKCTTAPSSSKASKSEHPRHGTRDLSSKVLPVRRNTSACVPSPIRIPRMVIHFNGLHILFASSTAMSGHKGPCCPGNRLKPGWIPTLNCHPKKKTCSCWLDLALSLSVSLSLSFHRLDHVGSSKLNSSMRTNYDHKWMAKSSPTVASLLSWQHYIHIPVPPIRTKSRKYTWA